MQGGERFGACRLVELLANVLRSGSIHERCGCLDLRGEPAVGGGEFGTLIPLPGVPTNVERGGAWTLQRLLLETQTNELALADRAFASAASPAGAEVLIET